MPSIYLSPSTQDHNEYIIGGSEEYYMNLIVDAMVPYLRASGITFARNNPQDTLEKVIEQSNSGNYDLHLAIHSNSAPENLVGVLRGPDAYYYAYSIKAQKAVTIFVNNLKNIYPERSFVSSIPNTTLTELKRTKAPAVLIEIAYHDNYSDAMWIAGNIDTIAHNLVLSITKFLGMTFVNPY